MTTTTATAWTPALRYNTKDGPCHVCGDIIGGRTFTVGVRDGGHACQSCVEALPIGEALWSFAEALDDLDTAIYLLPAPLRANFVALARDAVGKIGEWQELLSTQEDR